MKRNIFFHVNNLKERGNRDHIKLLKQSFKS